VKKIIFYNLKVAFFLAFFSGGEFYNPDDRLILLAISLHKFLGSCFIFTHRQVIFERMAVVKLHDLFASLLHHH
jgi:hypothetical protein